MEGIDRTYKEMVANFSDQFMGMITQATGAFTDLKKNILDNNASLRVSYAKGHDDILGQMEKANCDMVASYTKNFEELKQSLKENYDALRAQETKNVESNMSKFKENCLDIIKKVPTLSPKIYEEAVKTLQDNHKKANVELEGSYKELIQQLEKEFQESVKKMALTAACNTCPDKSKAGPAPANNQKPAAAAPVPAKPAAPAPPKPAAPAPPKPAPPAAGKK